MNSISRKNFLHLAAKGTAALPFIAPAFAQGTTYLSPKGNTTPPVFRFIQANDIHVQDDRSHYAAYLPQRVGATYHNANARALWLVHALHHDPALADVDFVLGIGDLVHGENLEAIKYDTDFFATHIYDKLPVPLYPAIGNHENAQREGNPQYEEPYKQLFGADKVNYGFVHKGLHFIVINNSGTWSIDDGEVLDQRLQALRRLLGEHPALPKIICSHIPLIPIRQDEVLAKSFGFSSYYTKEKELLQLLEQHQDQVLAVLSGHIHISGVVKQQSIHHIVVSGLASFPHDFAVYTVYEDRIDVVLTQVPSDLLAPGTNIHGAGRFGIDYTDSLHPDYMSYLMGNTMERRFSIPLKQ